MSAKALKFAAVAVFDICIVLAIAVGIKELINKHTNKVLVSVQSCNCNKE